MGLFFLVFIFSVVTLIRESTTSSIVCASTGRACVTSKSYVTCIPSNGNYIVTNLMAITCPDGQICAEDGDYACVVGDSTASSTICASTGRACVTSNSYVTCILSNGKYIVSDLMAITCPNGQICTEVGDYACIVGDSTSLTTSSSIICASTGRACVTSNSYVTCLLSGGKYVVSNLMAITCPNGQICTEVGDYACIVGDSTALTTASSIICAATGRACVTSNSYVTCILSDGKYVVSDLLAFTCPNGQICSEVGDYACIVGYSTALRRKRRSITCASTGRACVTSKSYVTCILSDGQYIVSDLMAITCPDGQICTEVGDHACIVGDSTAVTTASSIVCASTGRACVTSNSYVTCILSDGKYVVSDLMAITCPTGQICTEVGDYACIVGDSTDSSVTCASTGRACVTSNSYVTCILSDGKYIVNDLMAITCPTGQICTEVGDYACVAGDSTALTTASSIICASTGRACVTSNSYVTCILSDGKYIVSDLMAMTCPNGQICTEVGDYACIVGDSTAVTTASSIICASTGRACVTSNSYVNCILSDGKYVVSNLMAFTCPNGQICTEAADYPCTSNPNAPTSSTTSIITTTVPAIPTPPTCTEEGTYPAPQCNQYYHCYSTLWLWWNLELLTCPDGQAYDDASSQCVPSTTCNVNNQQTTAPTTTTSTTTTTTTKPTTTTTKTTTSTTKTTSTTTKTTTSTTKPTTSTTKSTTTTTTTTIAPTTPLCAEETTFPAPQCNQYYRCFAVMWWFSSELLTCPDGQAYDETSGQCVASTTCKV